MMARLISYKPALHDSRIHNYFLPVWEYELFGVEKASDWFTFHVEVGLLHAFKQLKFVKFNVWLIAITVTRIDACWWWNSSSC